MIELVLGGARSGKSRFAEERISQIAQLNSAQESPPKNCVFTYIATAQAHDSEMEARIKQHQTDRKNATINWQLIEEPLALANCLQCFLNDSSDDKHFILIDCLTLWVTNCLCSEQANNHTNLQVNQQESAQINTTFFQQEKANLLTILTKINQHKNITLVLVSNEVGHGIVPLGALSREFVDQSGWLHQDIAKLASKVDFIMAGLPINLKSGCTQ